MAWLKKVHAMFEDITNWLTPLMEKNLIELDGTKTVPRNEQHIGIYEAPVLVIMAGTERVRLTPVATLILAGYGRIDMKGPRGHEIMLVLAASNRPPVFKTRIFVDNEPTHGSESDDDAPAEYLSSAEIIEKQCRWYFANPENRGKMILVTEQLFKDVLSGMFQP